MRGAPALHPLAPLLLNCLSAHYQQYIRKDLSVAPLPGAWDGLGPIPLSSDITGPSTGPSSL